MILKDKSIFESLTKGIQKVKMDAVGTITEEGALRAAVSDNKEDMAKTFMFMAENTSVEWSLYSSLENGKYHYGLGTYQFDDITPNNIDIGLTGKIISLIHSHPNLQSNIEDEKESLWGDQTIAIANKNKFKYYMFAPKSGNLYQIENKSGNIMLRGKIKSFNQLLIYMK